MSSGVSAMSPEDKTAAFKNLYRIAELLESHENAKSNASTLSNRIDAALDRTQSSSSWRATSLQFAHRGIAIGREVAPLAAQLAMGAAVAHAGAALVPTLGTGVVASVAVGSLAVTVAAVTAGLESVLANALAKARGIEEIPETTQTLQGAISALNAAYVASMGTPGFVNAVGSFAGASLTAPLPFIACLLANRLEGTGAAIASGAYIGAIATGAVVAGAAGAVGGKVATLASGAFGLLVTGTTSIQLMGRMISAPNIPFWH